MGSAKEGATDKQSPKQITSKAGRYGLQRKSAIVQWVCGAVCILFVGIFAALRAEDFDCVPPVTLFICLAILVEGIGQICLASSAWFSSWPDCDESDFTDEFSYTHYWDNNTHAIVRWCSY